MPLNATDVANDWANGLVGAVAKIKKGVMAVTEAPTELAAQAADAYMQGVQMAVQTNRFQDGCRSVTLQDWQKATAEKGANNITTGVAFAKPKMVKFLQFLLPETERIKREIKQMPRGRGAAAKARMDANFEAMSALRYKGRR